MSAINATIESAIRTTENKAPMRMGKKAGEPIQTKPKPILLVSERSIFSDRNVFMLANVESGNIKPHHAAIYDEIYRSLLYNSHYLEKAMIYVTAQPDKCHERIMMRNRTVESDVELKYLDSLEDYHEKMIKEFNGSVLVLKNNGSVEQIVISIKALVNDLKQILTKDH
jgi:deoxyadenosine/deoxycytidine kinase